MSDKTYRPRYELRGSDAEGWKVIRKQRAHGTYHERIIGTWDMEHQATSVQSELTKWAGTERGVK